MATILLYSFLVLFSSQENEYERAVELFRQGYYERSLKKINSYLEVNFVKEAFYFKHKVQVQLGDLYGAAETLTGILQYYPDYAEARVSRAMVYRSLDLPRLVIEDLIHLINNPPDETNAIFFQIDPTGNSQVKLSTTVTMEGQFYRIIAEQYMLLEDYQRAHEYIDQAVRIDSIPENLMTRALLYEEMGLSNNAKTELLAVIKLDSNNALAWYNLALLEPGIEIPKQVLAKEEFAPMVSLTAVEEMRAGHLAEAEKLFKIALKKNSKDPLTHINYGRLLLKMGKNASAKLHFTEAYKLDDKRIEALYLLGNAYSKEKEYEAAIAHYEKYLSIDPTKPQVWYNAAVNYRMAGSNADACRCLKRAVAYGMDVSKRSGLWSACQ